MASSRRLAVACIAVLVGSTVVAAQDDDPIRRRRPGREPRPAAELRRPERPAYQHPSDFLPVPDRWRIVESVGVNERWWDPYHQNTLKADRPIRLGHESNWFINLNAIADTLAEGRRLPVPVGIQATKEAGQLDVFGQGDQLIFNQNLIARLSLIQGDTVFRPPDHEFRLTVVPNFSFVKVGERGLVRVDPDEGTTRLDGHIGVQEAFYDKHLWNKSEYYDFDSLRVGIQPFISDFRGFVYQDTQPGIRLFGNFWSNRVQYNLAYFRRLEKDTNSGLNRVDQLRDDDLFFLNGYFQDFLNLGFQTSALLLYNRNREGDDAPHFNDNGFIERPASIGQERPHDYDVVYLGVGGDGHIRRLNLTANLFFATGRDDFNSIAGRDQTIAAYLALAEASVDFDWYRLKVFGYHASGDGDPFDGVARGFDAVFENPNFAGAGTSFWQRQNIPLVGGGGVAISGRNSLLPALRSSKEEGQSNFVNPGLILFGVGGDFDLYPEFRLISNISYLAFHETEVLETVRQQSEVGQPIGVDVSVGFIWRPLFIENVVFNFGAAGLFAQQGLDDLYDETALYSVFLNSVLTY